jgi:TonB family C-terminal domain
VTYPEKARSKNKEGVFYINFIVDKDGKLTAFELVDKEGSLNLENNTIKSLMELPPWNPAIYKNKPVKQAFTLPLRFKLE